MTENIEPGLQHSAEALYDALNRLVRIYQFRDRDRICCHDVSVTQCYALETLVQNGPMRLNVLAEQLLLDKSTASRVIDALERKVYAARVSDAEDRRVVIVQATEAGIALHARIREELVTEQQIILQSIPLDARAGAIELLNRLAEAASKRSSSAESKCSSSCRN